jgi:hypothetical protein
MSGIFPFSTVNLAKIAEILTFPGENSCWPGTGESLLVLELQEPEDTTAGDNFPLQTEVAIDR